MIDKVLGSQNQSEFLLALTAIMSVVLLLVLWIIIRMETKMKKIEHKLDEIGDNASQMVKLGLRYFGDQK